MVEEQNAGEWRVIRVVENPEEAIVVAGFLKSRGIPAKIESLHVEELPVNVGGLGEVRVRVPEERFAEALALLEEQELKTAAPVDAPEVEAAAERSPASEQDDDTGGPEEGGSASSGPTGRR
ncbi:MAG TPA: DUF2007 domain-containing protein [Thermoanaerobaculia bacterium]|nr:DUF2007 domain-containing protein [Thermoanaerobaculia bacterium]